MGLIATKFMPDLLRSRRRIVSVHDTALEGGVKETQNSF